VTRYRGLVTAHFPHEAEDAAKIAGEIGALEDAVEKLRVGALSGAEADRALAELSGSVARVLDATEKAAAAELDEFVAFQRGVDDELAAQERMIGAVALVALLCALFAGARIAGLVARPSSRCATLPASSAADASIPGSRSPTTPKSVSWRRPSTRWPSSSRQHGVAGVVEDIIDSVARGSSSSIARVGSNA